MVDVRLMKKQAVISVAAGKSQVLVIEKAKKMGYAVIGIDRDPNAAGFQFCDECINLSTYESAPVIEQLKQLQKKYEFKGVLNRSFGIPVITTAEICDAFHLHGVSPAAARIVIDKSSLISFCNENNIPAPLNVAVESLQEIRQELIKFPCVVKPALPVTGKSGVTKVERVQDLDVAFNKAKNASITGVVNIEEYIEGRDVVLMSVVNGGRVYSITLLDEVTAINDKGEFYGVGYAVPSVFTSFQEEKNILALAQQIVDKLRLDTSVFLMSCRCDFGRAPKLIEIHLDFGGDLVLDHLMPASADFDVLASFVGALIGDVPELPKNNFRPTAIIYGEGKGLVSDKPHTLIHAGTRDELDREIYRQIN
ncbi:MAG: hypothetical protein A3G38_02695 [Omnitrophica WOR_2 bacterium RIFCSPLOWO2_12_FULL_51_8]|nr:MAG: hypothetical protein A3G38_02695 [Omnitrophica WOR_2 bacterium RIFCSPLOWO2_12_FULL_51_8]